MPLLDDVADLRSLSFAWRHVKVNKRVTPGIDNIDIEEFSNNLPQNLESIHSDLLNRKFRFSKVLESKIPKKNKKEFRKIALYTIRDKIVQKSVQILFEKGNKPLFPEIRNNVSIGYISRITKHELLGIGKAVASIKQYEKEGYVVMTSADICDFFVKLDRDKLFKTIKSRLKPDDSLDWLVTEMLNPLLVELDRKTDVIKDLPMTSSGVSQGSVLSPLLSNIYLMEFDKELEKRKLPALRYADDLAFFSKTIEEANSNLIAIESLLKSYKLELHKKGTEKEPKHYRLDSRFGIYLGIRFQKDVKKNWSIKPVDEKIHSLKENIKERINNSDLSFSERIIRCNSCIRGWFETYYKVGCTKKNLMDIFGEIKSMYVKEVNNLLKRKEIVSTNLSESKLNFLGVLTDKYLFNQ